MVPVRLVNRSRPAMPIGPAGSCWDRCWQLGRCTPSPYGWYVAYPLVLLSIYVREIAHGLAAALVGG